MSEATHDTAYGAGHHGDPTGWRRWVYSTNHKDIGTMYITFAVIAGLIGGAFSIYMRMELPFRISDGHCRSKSACG